MTHYSHTNLEVTDCRIKVDMRVFYTTNHHQIMGIVDNLWRNKDVCIERKEQVRLELITSYVVVLDGCFPLHYKLPLF